MNSCEWTSLRSALAHFVRYRGKTQSQQHIRPIHWYVASRLVVEGGFHPDEIVPRPPFRVRGSRSRQALVHDPALGGTGERTVYGGLKTKDVDVVVTDQRFVYGAPDLRHVTARNEWANDSSAFSAAVLNDLDYGPRIDDR